MTPVTLANLGNLSNNVSKKSKKSFKESSMSPVIKITRASESDSDHDKRNNHNNNNEDDLTLTDDNSGELLLGGNRTNNENSLKNMSKKRKNKKRNNNHNNNSQSSLKGSGIMVDTCTESDRESDHDHDHDHCDVPIDGDADMDANTPSRSRDDSNNDKKGNVDPLSSYDWDPSNMPALTSIVSGHEDHRQYSYQTAIAANNNHNNDTNENNGNNNNSNNNNNNTNINSKKDSPHLHVTKGNNGTRRGRSMSGNGSRIRGTRGRGRGRVNLMGGGIMRPPHRGRGPNRHGGNRERNSLTVARAEVQGRQRSSSAARGGRGAAARRGGRGGAAAARGRGPRSSAAYRGKGTLTHGSPANKHKGRPTSAQHSHKRSLVLTISKLTNKKFANKKPQKAGAAGATNGKSGNKANNNGKKAKAKNGNNKNGVKNKTTAKNSNRNISKNKTRKVRTNTTASNAPNDSGNFTLTLNGSAQSSNNSDIGPMKGMINICSEPVPASNIGDANGDGNDKLGGLRQMSKSRSKGAGVSKLKQDSLGGSKSGKNGSGNANNGNDNENGDVITTMNSMNSMHSMQSVTVTDFESRFRHGSVVVHDEIDDNENNMRYVTESENDGSDDEIASPLTQDCNEDGDGSPGSAHTPASPDSANTPSADNKDQDDDEDDEADPSNWTLRDVTGWLKEELLNDESISMNAVRKVLLKFEVHCVTGDVLLILDEEKLEEFGITKNIMQSKILNLTTKLLNER